MPSVELRDLLAHMTWADALVWRHVMDLTGVEDDARLTGLLHHVHTVQLAYVQLLRDEPLDLPDESDFASAAALLAWGRACHDEVRTLVAAIDEDENDVQRLEREVAFPWAEQLAAAHGPVHPTTTRQALLQLASHSTYHRGQINTRIRELGGEPPLTDFVAWVWQGCPEPAWPEVPADDDTPPGPASSAASAPPAAPDT